MLGFEIWKNGKKLATAGLTEGGAISLMLTWVGKGSGASSRAADGGQIEGLDLRVGGIDSSDPDGEQSVEWIEDDSLRLDDDIQIKIVSVDAIDAPIRREPTRGLSSGESALRLVTCGTCGSPRLQPAAQPAE